ncbi:hypothetical protein MKX03_018978 [Papaver bracteatum]|nr:hypothetical protein MKX03_018978 [Papaver bracteatum]
MFDPLFGQDVRSKQVSRCITSVGLYVPGGTAVLPSTTLVLAVIISLIAGCKSVVLDTPPGKDGSICKEVLYGAKKDGVTHFLKAEDAQVVVVTAAKMIFQVFLSSPLLSTENFHYCF